MNACRAELALLALLLAACHGAAFAPAAVKPLESSAASPRAALPDDVERSAAEIARLALAGSSNSPELSAELERLRAADQERIARGEPPTGLSDNALDLVQSSGNAEAYDKYAEDMLRFGSPDPELRRDLENHLAEKPLNVAAARMKDERSRVFATYFNLITAPFATFAFGGFINPIETGRAALLSVLVARSESNISTRERQALRAYRDFLARNPDSPQASQIKERVQVFQDRLDRQREDEALGAAQRSIQADRPDAALLHLARAARSRPNDVQGIERLQQTAQRQLEADQVRLVRDLGPRFSGPDTDLDSEQLPALATRILLSDWAQPLVISADPNGAVLEDEISFVDASRELEQGQESAAFDHLQSLAAGRSNMATHADAILKDPDQNPYAAHQAVRRLVAKRQTSFLLLGSRANGPKNLDLPLLLKPIGLLLEVPAYAVVVLTTPIRLLQLPSAGKQFRTPLLTTGERYVARFPKGSHAEEINRELESLYAEREGWAQALAHHKALAQTDPLKIGFYREKLAERLLEAARRPRRLDVRNQIYESLLSEYGETAAARTGADELRKLLANATPQSIRITKQFLMENPELWQPGALPLRPELMDDKADNGELDDQGVTLLGKQYVRVALVDRDPYTAKVSEAELGRFVSLLQEAYERRLATDTRASPDPDPQRDAFFEQIQLGLAARTDMRPTASSEYVFEGTKEKFGSVPRAGSILPVELVLRGGLEDLGLAALPRMKMPEETRDAYLYR